MWKRGKLPLLSIDMEGQAVTQLQAEARHGGTLVEAPGQAVGVAPDMAKASSMRSLLAPGISIRAPLLSW